MGIITKGQRKGMQDYLTHKFEDSLDWDILSSNESAMTRAI